MVTSRFYDFPEGSVESSVRFGIFGIPWDANSTHMHGCARAGPQALRSLTSFLSGCTETEQDIFNFNVEDFGDVEIYPSLPDRTRENIATFVRTQFPWELMGKTFIPVMIGGDHYCSYPVVKNLAEIHADRWKHKFGYLVFDAHLDYYDKWRDLETDFHCTVTKRIADLPQITPAHIAIVGVRDMDGPELEQIHQDQVYYVPAYRFSQAGMTTQLESELNKIISHFHRQGITDLYLSLDIDVLEGCYASGTGYTIPGGLTYREMWHALHYIVQKCNIIGFDLTEVAPDMDTPSKLTQITAVKLITELMGFIIQKEAVHEK